MYGLVPYNISDKQKMIQYGHAVVEYSISKLAKTSAYKKWSQTDKTFIVLDGGTTNNGKVPVWSNRRYSGMPETDLGTMQKYYLELERNGVDFAYFTEPDLNDAMTGIVFLVDERVFNRVKYPCPVNGEYYGDVERIEPSKRNDFFFNKGNVDNAATVYAKWVKTIGGKQNEFLRYFLPKFKLA